MDTRLIGTFLKANDLGSITKAATELGYAQSTVTTQIQQLESELGFPLFDRIGKRISLTSLGQQFLPYAIQISQLAQQARFLGKTPDQMHGTLRVGVLESLLFSVLTDVLPQYKEIYPNVDLQIKMGHANDLMDWLRKNELDLVYYSHNPTIDPEFHCCSSKTETMLFVGPPYHHFASRSSVSLEEFLSQPIVITERTGVCYQRLQELAAQHNLSLRHAAEVGSTRAVSTLVAKGMGCAFLPAYSIKTELETRQLVSLAVDVPPQEYCSQIIYHREKWIPPYMAALIALIQSYREASPDVKNQSTAVDSFHAACYNER